MLRADKMQSLNSSTERFLEMTRATEEVSQVYVDADPSIASQLRRAVAADPLNKPLLVEAYMEAVRICPDASQGTKRKWRRIIGL